jgi:hypothetical protein
VRSRVRRRDCSYGK